jgi:predicted aminopeptidase
LLRKWPWGRIVLFNTDVGKTSCPSIVIRSLLVVSALALTSCAALNDSVGYYLQSASGHMNILRSARPIADWLADPATPEPLRRKLTLVAEIRTYASSELGLPDNGSYTKYADLKQPFVVWNVVATPELSLQLRQWCFPVAGCVTYRGYYNKEAAEAFAKPLKEQGDDIQIGGVPAYSTLGYFDDPVLNTFINYPDAELARLIFHELSHQVVYVKGDTTFNESFATAVETIGVERWLRFKANQKLTADYRAFASRRVDFLGLLKRYRAQLETAYKTLSDDAAKRTAKRDLIAALRADYETLKQTRWNGFKGYDRFFAQELGNAHLASVATYTDLVPGFLALAKTVDPADDKSLRDFFVAAEKLAQLEKSKRNTELGELAKKLQ